MNRNIYEGLLTDENHYSDAICNLCSIEEFSIKFAQILSIEGLKKIESLNISTRTNTDRNGFPDIVYTGKDIAIAFEVKTQIKTRLTGNQPEGYMNYLASFKNKQLFLILLIPIGYKHEDQFKKRFEKWNKKKGFSVKLRIIYWQDIIYEFLISFKDNYIISQFCQQVDFEYKKENIMFSDEEMLLMESNTALLFRQKVDKVISNILTELKKEKIKFIKSSKDDDDNTYYIINNKNEYLFWFGRWDELWENEEYALVVGCNDDHKFIEKFKNCKRYKTYSYDPITSQDDKEEITMAMFNKIKKYI